jgi:ABC-type transport system involved in multi-copper enzyme maturation permease subunit
VNFRICDAAFRINPILVKGENHYDFIDRSIEKMTMAYNGGMSCIKYLLFLFNFIFWVFGIGIIVAGAVIQIRYSNYINFLGDSFLSAPILLIAVGCVIAVMGFFGCCGAIRENYCMAMTFAVLLGLIFILELAAGIAGYILRNEVEQVIKGHAIVGMSHYNMTGSSGVTDAWDRPGQFALLRNFQLFRLEQQHLVRGERERAGIVLP